VTVVVTVVMPVALTVVMRMVAEACHENRSDDNHYTFSEVLCLTGRAGCSPEKQLKWSALRIDI